MKQVICSGQANVYLNEKEINGMWNAVGLLQIYFEKTASMEKYEASVMCSVHAVL